MICPYCRSLTTKQRCKNTSLGYRTYWCQSCQRTFNERTGTPFSQKRDMDAAKRFFLQALQTVGSEPERVTTDGHRSYPCAIREVLGTHVLHRWKRRLNNYLEQDHRGIKQRYSPMRGFGNFVSA